MGFIVPTKNYIAVYCTLDYCLTSVVFVLYVFKCDVQADSGVCQSCAAKLDLRQCVSHLETHRPSVCYSSQSDRSISADCKLQSGEVMEVLNPSGSSDNTDTAVAQFLDETPGTSWSVDSDSTTNLQDIQPHVELASFLKRPVLIKTFTWAQTDSYVTTTTFQPWHLFFNSTPIKNKLNNYSFINCKLKVKFVINASPFYYGALYFAYSPLQALNGNSIINDGAGELIPYSQRPGVWVFPQTCAGGEITLPFFYHKNWLDITSATDTQDMGLFTPVLYSALSSANGVTGTSVVVNIYAWAEDVKLHAPTTKLALQGDEFDYKPSQLASAVSSATRALSRVPLIGPYMKATSMVSSKFASMASSLGFTNVPNMDTVSPYKPYAFAQNTTCDVSIPQDRTVVDPKNEVSIDPRTVGLDGQDELELAYIAGRESYIGSAILSSTDSIDNLTMAANVTPCLTYTTNVLDRTKPLQFTPMGYLGDMFKFWRGDIIFRFKFICSRFHKGRVRITWDPKNNITTSIPDYTTVFNEVVDIGAEQDIEVRVPYSQATTFLPTYTNNGNFTMSGATITPDIHSNGMVTMRVVNPLSGPQATTAISVLVFARAAENIEFAVPYNTFNTQSTMDLQYTPYALQSGEVYYPVKPRQVIVGNKSTDPDPNRYVVHFGESIKSFRPLIHRMYLQYQVQASSLTSAATLNIIRHRTSRRLKYFGYTTNAWWTANQTVGVGTSKCNYVRTSIPQLVSLLFVGQRGSITHQYNVETTNFLSSSACSNITLCRHDGVLTPSTQFLSYDNNTSTNANNQAQIAMRYQSDPYSGVALTDQRLQPAISANFPYYSNYNFQFVNPANANAGSESDGTNEDNISLTVIWCQGLNNAKPQVINAWSALGHDYNFFFFLNCPSLYRITIPTGA